MTFGALQMTTFQSTSADAERQAIPVQDPGRLEAILDGVDDTALVERLQQYRWTGRQGYPLCAMWRPTSPASSWVCRTRTP